MAWLNASGQPVATQSMTVQIDVPCECVGDHGKTLNAVSWPAVLLAMWQLGIAMMGGNPQAIAVAIQALLNAFMGK